MLPKAVILREITDGRATAVDVSKLRIGLHGGRRRRQIYFAAHVGNYGNAASAWADSGAVPEIHVDGEIQLHNPRRSEVISSARRSSTSRSTFRSRETG